ncbi:carboxy terminal-processing peptidase [Anaerobiospirillum succiniciproducens]|uniref:carboxy terminal-processing peptidase n=1 Tax=Anaerobiospirillum succiniciproducens TaxID=13335 RepID=UPI00248E5FDC|nr:carboxy terminal-processing peptidase [Anaerobiospirillum succiniciproducens]
MLKLNFSRLALCLALLVTSVTAEAKLEIPTKEDLPVLAPEGMHQTACTRTANSYLRAHYKAIDVDNEFVDKVIKQYLYMLDYNKSLFTKAEVDEIYANRDRITRSILLCDLSYPYELYNFFIQRRFNKYSYFVDTLKAGNVDLSTDETIELKRNDAEFLADEDALKQQWLKELKNELILQLLSDKTEKEAYKRLTNRYNAALSKIAQTRSEDVFSVFENAFATAIDPHTSYLSPEDSENFNDNINLSLEGIGAVLTSDDEYTVINSVLPGSPAERTKKLKAKDKILGVRQADGTYDDIIGWRLNEVVKKIKGPKGTKITLDIERGDGSQISTFSVDIIRDKVRMQDSEAKIEVKKHKGKQIAVLKIKSFYTNLNLDIKKEIERVQAEGTKIDALVVDLRNNGGGLLPEATLSSGLFIKQGPIVLVRDARGNVMPQIDSDSKVAYDGPLVVLINRLSASSSEIMAAALSDYGRALIVGDTSFGKGTVQQSKPLARVYDFNDQELGSIHYTIAKFYRINGGSTQLKGVSPDIYLPSLVDHEEYGEGSENNALPWDKINPAPYEAILNIAAYVPELQRLSDKRSSKNEVFKIMKTDMDRYYKLKNDKVLSINLDKRKALKDEDDAYRIKTTNKRLALLGKKPIKKLDDLPDDFEFDDVVLNETVAIASDFADAQKQKLYKASKAPVLTRFQVERDEISKGSGTSSPPGAAAMPARPDADRVQNSSLKSKAHAKAKESTKEGAKDSTKDSTEKTAALEGSVATAAAAEMKEPQSYGVSMQADSAEFSAQSYATGTGEINNMDADGALLGPWRTVNEDDTYLRVSDTEFKALIEDSNTNSTVNYLRDNSYPSVMQEDSAVAEDKSVIRMVR